MTWPNYIRFADVNTVIPPTQAVTNDIFHWMSDTPIDTSGRPTVRRSAIYDPVSNTRNLTIRTQGRNFGAMVTIPPGSIYEGISEAELSRSATEILQNETYVNLQVRLDEITRNIRRGLPMTNISISRNQDVDNMDQYFREGVDQLIGRGTAARPATLGGAGGGISVVGGGAGGGGGLTGTLTGAWNPAPYGYFNASTATTNSLSAKHNESVLTLGILKEFLRENLEIRTEVNENGGEVSVKTTILLGGEEISSDSDFVTIYKDE
jgi:hypothetical protein